MVSLGHAGLLCQQHVFCGTHIVQMVENQMEKKMDNYTETVFFFIRRVVRDTYQCCGPRFLLGFWYRVPKSNFKIIFVFFRILHWPHG